MMTWPVSLPRRDAALPAPRPLPLRLVDGLPSVPRVSRESFKSRKAAFLAALAVEGYSWQSTSSVFSAWSTHSAFSFASAGSFGSALSFGSIGSMGSILSIGSTGSILSIGSAGSILSIGGAGQVLGGWAGDVPRDGTATDPAGLAGARFVERGATILGTCALVAAAVTR